MEERSWSLRFDETLSLEGLWVRNSGWLTSEKAMRSQSKRWRSGTVSSRYGCSSFQLSPSYSRFSYSSVLEKASLSVMGRARAS